MQKHIPLLFSGPMAIANIEGRKTQTRRIINFKFITHNEIASVHPDGSGTGWVAWAPKVVSAEQTKAIYPGEDGFKCRYGKPGDIIWQRETWMHAPNAHLVVEQYKYRALASQQFIDEWPGYWKPSIFMPKTAARFFAEIKSGTGGGYKRE